MFNPLCQKCLEKGKTTLAIDVHHIDSFMNYQGLKRTEKAYDINNLVSLCKECHAEEHLNGTTKEFNLTLKRTYPLDNYTIGELYIEGEYYCDTLEDTVREEKIAGKTAIPYGKYEVIVNRSPKFKEIYLCY